MRLADAVVLIVGSSGGVGSACASAVSGRGARVIVHGRDTDRLEAVAADAGAKWLAADLTLPGAPRALTDAAREVHGRIDVVIACAGLGWLGPTEGISPDKIDELVAVNLTAPMQLTQAVLGEMRARRRGHLVYLASIAGWVGVAQEAVYSAAKAGVIAFADSVRSEVSGTGIGVSVISPAAVRTPFFERRGTAYDRRVPRPVAPERIADVVVRAIEHDVAQQMVPRWLALAPAVRATVPAAFRTLNRRFGQAPAR